MRLRSAALLFVACCVKADVELRGTRQQHKLAEIECKAGISSGAGCKKPEPFHQLARDLKVAICPDDKGEAFYEAVSIIVVPLVLRGRKLASCMKWIKVCTE
jgi:hypothetical protein